MLLIYEFGVFWWLSFLDLTRYHQLAYSRATIWKSVQQIALRISLSVSHSAIHFPINYFDGPLGPSSFSLLVPAALMGRQPVLSTCYLHVPAPIAPVSRLQFATSSDWPNPSNCYLTVSKRKLHTNETSQTNEPQLSHVYINNPRSICSPANPSALSAPPRPPAPSAPPRAPNSPRSS
jgi:hypothetical protein